MKIPLYFVLQSLQKARPTLNFADKNNIIYHVQSYNWYRISFIMPRLRFCLQELQDFANAQKEHRILPTSSSWFISLSCKSHMRHNLKKFLSSIVMPFIKNTSFLVFFMQCEISHHPPSKIFLFWCTGVSHLPSSSSGLTRAPQFIIVTSIKYQSIATRKCCFTISLRFLFFLSHFFGIISFDKKLVCYCIQLKNMINNSKSGFFRHILKKIYTNEVAMILYLTHTNDAMFIFRVKLKWSFSNSRKMNYE